MKSILSIDWRKTTDGSYLLTSGADKALRHWNVIQDDDRIKVTLQWCSAQNELVVTGALFQDVQDLSHDNLMLIKQHSAITNEP
jgi:WD40 repeat protein